ncbi:MAG: SDR family oxidoreductase [Prevotellaceae bacterium]|jgi:NAD(P)-dependent dehydrogenase (short-subunit alcohol dehydrogenase family)|nr:SDR family oxidoreductase [Prevotellaceae bacterium]
MYNPFSLEGKTILVTGASSGIGRAAAIECSKMGATVVITGRNKERLDETYLQLHGEGHIQLVADLKEEESISYIIDNVPVLDGCVNNAGITVTLPTSFINKDALNNVLQVNTISPILLTQSLVKNKKIKNGGSIVFTCSTSGVYNAVVGNAIYSASKGAINGFMKNAALDLAAKNIRVNAVSPGMIHTNILESGIISEEQLKEDMKKYPLKRYGEPEEVAYAMIYLLSDASKWITGSNLLIDGGLTLL